MPISPTSGSGPSYPTEGPSKQAGAAYQLSLVYQSIQNLADEISQNSHSPQITDLISSAKTAIQDALKDPNVGSKIKTELENIYNNLNPMQQETINMYLNRLYDYLLAHGQPPFTPPSSPKA